MHTVLGASWVGLRSTHEPDYDSVLHYWHSSIALPLYSFSTTPLLFLYLPLPLLLSLSTSPKARQICWATTSPLPLPFYPSLDPLSEAQTTDTWSVQLQIESPHLFFGCFFYAFFRTSAFFATSKPSVYVTHVALVLTLSHSISHTAEEKEEEEEEDKRERGRG